MLPVCMKYAARGESQVVNVAWGKAECYICHETHTKSCILLYKQSSSALSILLYFTLWSAHANALNAYYNYMHTTTMP